MIVVKIKMGFLQQLLLSQLMFMAGASSSFGMLMDPDCPTICGDIQIPYPFGIAPGCGRSQGFELGCADYFYGPLSLGSFNVKNLSLDGEILIWSSVLSDCYNNHTFSGHYRSGIAGINISRATPYTFSTRNMFTTIGCATEARIRASARDFSGGCMTFCEGATSAINGSCSGIGCCQTSIPNGIREFSLNITSDNSGTTPGSFIHCGYAFLGDQNEFSFTISDLYGDNFVKRSPNVPIVLDWAIGNGSCGSARKQMTDYACQSEFSECLESPSGAGYLCKCSQGYRGNPYLVNGCQDIDECEETNHTCTDMCTNQQGTYICSCPSGKHGDGRTDGSGCTRRPAQVTKLVVAITTGVSCIFMCSLWLYWVFKKRKLIRLKQKFFKQNGGLLLESLAPKPGGIEIMKIFNAEELQKATNNFHQSRVIGQGGFGTVYKGILQDQRVVAVKKSKIVDESQIGQFINEILILYRMNHRNVVKLLGCCLETETPLLVYEFISNGNLHQHIHGNNCSTGLSWKSRLRIASETAGALAFLHSSTSTPIIHRDVKSSNILLDENFIAKVSDFGVSRLVPLGQTKVTTMVQGTFGYLDPQYFQSGKLSEKSDVYSFGVVLVELLTGEKSISLARPEEERSLAMHFISAMREERLFDILEKRVVKEGEKDQLIAVAEIARRCLHLKGGERPTMKEVASLLERTDETRHVHTKDQFNFEEKDESLDERMLHPGLSTGSDDSIFTSRN